jgi:hypothetical protein
MSELGAPSLTQRASEGPPPQPATNERIGGGLCRNVTLRKRLGRAIRPPQFAWWTGRAKIGLTGKSRREYFGGENEPIFPPG